MFGLTMVMGIIGIIFGMVSAFGIFIADQNKYKIFWVTMTVLMVIVASFGITKNIEISRQNCENAGFTWVNGECFANNINVHVK